MNSQTLFTPRLLTASQYILELFEPKDNVAVLTRNRATGKTLQRIAPAETVASSEFLSWLAHQNVCGSDIFVGMNPVGDAGLGRTKQNIKVIRHVYLDLDRGGDASLKAIRETREVPAPNFVLDTSPAKHQVVWRVTGLAQKEAELLLHDLASRFGGDLAATDSTRVLRLPGFANRKLPNEFIVQVRQESDATYTLHDFRIQEGSPEAQRQLTDAQKATRTLPIDHISQSERDWAYAKRALARGEDPEAVINKIAKYRASDKAKPDYYARLTVTKALADLRSNDRAPHDDAHNKLSSSPELNH
jgi:hypothetical protein